MQKYRETGGDKLTGFGVVMAVRYIPLLAAAFGMIRLETRSEPDGSASVTDK